MRGESKFKITNVVREILLDTPEIVALVEDKVFPLIASKNTKGDFIIYQRDEYSVDRTKMGVTSQKCRVYVNAVSEDYDRGQNLAGLIYEALEGDFLEPDMRIRLEDSTEDYEDGKYIQVLLFSIE
ncbi:tail completion protein gp17 [Parabacteroides pacaensis]|uniref:tail completion protein gp17 n=1 Tax=Parabacteroides pacaensis TaxID=2086575 RepID=UPI000D113639|nr:DUF3168 domain-containing protein [Parabacteroides pacaensis]